MRPVDEPFPWLPLARRLFVGMCGSLAYNFASFHDHLFGTDAYFLINGPAWFDADEMIRRHSMTRRRHVPSDALRSARAEWRP